MFRSHIARLKQLEVCASLEIDYIGKGGYPVPLYFLWRYEGNPIYASETQMYSPGYIVVHYNPDQENIFSLELPSRNTKRPFKYASIEFSVVAGKVVQMTTQPKVSLGGGSSLADRCYSTYPSYVHKCVFSDAGGRGANLPLLMLPNGHKGIYTDPS